jgi:hypothetical protein
MAFGRYLLVILITCIVFGFVQRRSSDSACTTPLRDAERIALGAALGDDGHMLIELARAYRLKRRWIDLQRLWERATKVLPAGSPTRRRLLALVTGEDDGLIHLEPQPPEPPQDFMPRVSPQLPTPRPARRISQVCGVELWTDSAIDELMSCADRWASEGRLDKATAALAEARARVLAHPRAEEVLFLITAHLAILGPEAALQLVQDYPWPDDAARDAAVVQLAYELVMGPGSAMPPADWSQHAALCREPRAGAPGPGGLVTRTEHGWVRPRGGR